jgi:hypothetical protein
MLQLKNPSDGGQFSAASDGQSTASHVSKLNTPTAPRRETPVRCVGGQPRKTPASTTITSLPGRTGEQAHHSFVMFTDVHVTPYVATCSIVASDKQGGEIGHSLTANNPVSNKICLEWDEQEQELLIDGVPLDQYQGTAVQNSGWDKADFERNAWIYLQCLQNVTYPRICAELRRMAPRWYPIEKVQGIRPRAIEFAKRLGLPPPSHRRRGRPSRVRHQ